MSYGTKHESMSYGMRHAAGDQVVRIVEGERERWYGGDRVYTEGWHATVLVWVDDREVLYEDTWAEPYSEER